MPSGGFANTTDTGPGQLTSGAPPTGIALGTGRAAKRQRPPGPGIAIDQSIITRVASQLRFGTAGHISMAGATRKDGL